MSIVSLMNALDRWGLMSDLKSVPPEATTFEASTIKKYVWTLVDAGPEAPHVDAALQDYLGRQLQRPELYSALKNPGPQVDLAWVSEAPEAEQIRSGTAGALARALPQLSNARNRPELALQLAVRRAGETLLLLQASPAKAFYDASGRPTYADPSEISGMHQAMHQAKGLGAVAEVLVPYLSRQSDPVAQQLASLLGEAWRVVDDRMAVKWR